MSDYEYGYINGFVERKSGGQYEGRLVVDGVDISPINAVYFKDDGNSYLWLKRNDIMQYDINTQSYYTRKRTPQWEVYMKKTADDNVVAYRGEFFFLRIKYSIIGVWDAILGKDKHRLNLYVERMPLAEQSIINGINEMRKKKG